MPYPKLQFDPYCSQSYKPGPNTISWATYACPLYPRQRGFIRTDKNRQNTAMANQILHYAMWGLFLHSSTVWSAAQADTKKNLQDSFKRHMCQSLHCGTSIFWNEFAKSMQCRHLHLQIACWEIKLNENVVFTNTTDYAEVENMWQIWQMCGDPASS